MAFPSFHDDPFLAHARAQADSRPRARRGLVYRAALTLIAGALVLALVADWSKLLAPIAAITELVAW